MTIVGDLQSKSDVAKVEGLSEPEVREPTDSAGISLKLFHSVSEGISLSNNKNNSYNILEV